eukprot:scaffold894_cov130-Isochrysis_galbana.AAC.5
MNEGWECCSLLSECIVAVQGAGCVFAAARARASVVRLSVSSCQLCAPVRPTNKLSGEFFFKLQTWRQTGARFGARLPPPGPPALAPGGTS